MTVSSRHETRTLFVVLLTAATMGAEIIAGLATRSMALLADGIHMGSHVLAIGLSWIAYVIVRRLSKKGDYRGDTGKILALSGYSSGLMLLIFALAILFQASQRLFDPAVILYREALIVAMVGLVVNVISAFLLHHEQEEADHNIRAAYLHVLADALTSITAIIGLTAAWVWEIPWIDPVVAFLGSLVIIRWAAGLLKATGKELLG